MRQFPGLKFRSQKRNSEKTSSSFLARNTAIQCGYCKSAERRKRLMVIPWSSAAVPTSDRRARLARSVSSKRKQLRRERVALKQSPVTLRKRGRSRKRRDSKRSLRRSRERD